MLKRGYKYLAIAAVGGAGACGLRTFMKGGQFTEDVSARGKVAVVTGGNAGVGLETVKGLNERGAKVYLLCRSEQRAAEAKAELEKGGCDGARLIYVNCDLSSKENIRNCAAKIKELEPHIDILVNNAGISMSGGCQLDEDGHEITWTTNYLGPFLLTDLLLPQIEKAPEGRIVNVASMAHNRSPEINLEKIDEEVDARTAYCKSKLANVMHARELSRRMREKGNSTVTVNSLHPGVIPTELLRNLGLQYKILSTIFAFFMKSPKDGAQTSLYCALSSEVKGVSGMYFADCAIKKESDRARDDFACKQLYEYSRKAVGLV